MKKVKIIRLDKESKKELVKNYANLPDEEKRKTSLEEHLEQNDNQTLLILRFIKNMRKWADIEDAEIFVEVIKKIKETKEDFIVLEDAEVKMVLKKAELKKGEFEINGNPLEQFINVINEFKNSEEVKMPQK